MIHPAERLTLALRYLATGESFSSLSFQFRISERAISYIVKEVCKAIVKHLVPVHLRVPSSTGEWLHIANTFEERVAIPERTWRYRRKACCH